MNQICYVVKPEEVSYESLCKLLDEAHASEKITFNTSGMTGEELEHALNGGVCIVAMDGNRAVGMAAICIENNNNWYYQGILGRIRFVAVDPNYRRKHIGFNLIEYVLNWCKQNALRAAKVSTSALNSGARNLYKRTGAVTVDSRVIKGGNQVVVTSMYYLDNKHPNIGYLKFKYHCRRIWVAMGQRRK